MEQPTTIEREKRGADSVQRHVRRLCQTHPDVNYKTEWGCPECVRVLREQKRIREEALREIKAVHTRWYRGDMPSDEAVRQMEHIAVGVWVREDSPNS